MSMAEESEWRRNIIMIGQHFLTDHVEGGESLEVEAEGRSEDDVPVVGQDEFRHETGEAAGDAIRGCPLQGLCWDRCWLMGLGLGLGLDESEVGVGAAL